MDMSSYDRTPPSSPLGHTPFTTDTETLLRARPKVPSQLYTDLQDWQTRLVRIRPGTEGSALHLDLVVVDIVHVEGVVIHGSTELITYDALSYSWGYLEAASAVFCNAHTCKVSSSLSDAFRAIRLPSKSRYLWVDAFCINQADTSEKSVQVQKMNLIFAKAQRVLVWLGNLQVAWRVQAIVADTSSDHWHLAGRLTEEVQACAWFKRTWIRQEVFCARQVPSFQRKQASLGLQ